MQLIRRKSDGKVMNFSEDGQIGSYPVPADDTEEEVFLPGVTVAEFEAACKISEGTAGDGQRPREMFLHDKPSATKMTKNKHVSLGDRHLESH